MNRNVGSDTISAPSDRGHATAVLALQLPTCFEMRTLNGGLVSSARDQAMMCAGWIRFC
jgi:hypothetical protein